MSALTEWRSIPSLNGLYEASSEGRIRSKRRRYGGTRWYGGDVLTTAVNPVSGYVQVNVSLFNKVRCVYVHRLVCEAFHGAPPKPRMDVNHKNGVRDDNRPENLEWLTRSENQIHSYANLPKAPQPARRRVKVSNHFGALIYETQCEAAKALGVSAGSISSAARRGHKCKGYEVEHA